MPRRAANRTSSFGPLCGRLLSLFLMGAMVWGGSIPQLQFCQEAAAASSWRVGPEFNATGSSMQGCWVNGTGAGARLELQLADDWAGCSQSGPAGLAYPAMCTLAGDDKVLLFGGVDTASVKDGTWVYDDGDDSWTRAAPAHSPRARYNTAMAMVPGDDKAVLFGGTDMQAAFNDTWVYDQSDGEWYARDTPAAPPPRFSFGMASVGTDDKVVLFGGDGEQLNRLNDTWIYDVGDNRWTQAFPPSSPPACDRLAMATVPGDDRVMLFGQTGSQRGPWIYDQGDNRWLDMTPQDGSAIGYRAGANIAPMFGEDRFLLFGGSVNTTFAFDLGDDGWTLLGPANAPAARSYFGMAAAHTTGNVMVLGGYDNSWSELSDSWMYRRSGRTPWGEYISPCKDIGGNSTYMYLDWNATVPAGTGLRFQLRSASSQNELSGRAFVGPIGTEDSFYIEPGAVFHGHAGDRMVQFRACLNTSSGLLTPSVKDVTIAFNRYPLAPNLTSPKDGVWTNLSRPTFNWSFRDPDSAGQSGFELELGRTPGPDNMDLTTGQQASDDASWTPDKALDEDSWYWRLRTRDDEGDWGPFSQYGFFRVDLTKPEAFTPRVEPPGWTSGPPLVHFNTSDALSGMDRYEIILDNASMGTRDSPCPLPGDMGDGVHAVLIRAYDRAGNRMDGRAMAYCDRTPPETFVPSASPASWSGSDPEIAFSATDASSGVDRYELSIDDGCFTRQTSPFPAAGLADGAHDVLVRAFDRAGNFREACITVFIDRTPPKGLYVTVSPGGWTSSQPVVDYGALDDASGLDRYEVGIDRGPFTVQRPPFTPSGLGDGAHTVTVRALDLAGNCAEMNATFHIDATPPVAFTPAAEPSGWTRTDPSVSFSTTDSGSGVDRYELSVGGGAFFNATSPARLKDLPDGEHRILVRALDGAGNSVEGSTTVRVDRTPPVRLDIRVGGQVKTATGHAVRLSLSAEDALSGLDAMAFSNDGRAYSDWEPFAPEKTWVPAPGERERKVYFKARDRAGNEAEVSSAVIDSRPPAPGPSMAIPLAASAAVLAAACAAVLVVVRRHRRPKAGK